MGGHDARLVRLSASRLYGDGQPIWDPEDRWNQHKRAEIDRFCRGFRDKLAAADRVLDAGCGNEPYDWLPVQTVSLDRFWRQVEGRPQGVVGDLRQLPFADGAFTFAVCVASVLNYVDPIAAIAELARVVEVRGRLLLHFETSTSFEHIGEEHWGRPATRIDTINAGRPDSIWVYQPAFIFRALEAVGFRIRLKRRFHIVSAAGLRLGLSQQAAARWALADRLATPLGAFADDVILLAERRAAGGGGAADGRRRAR